MKILSRWLVSLAISVLALGLVYSVVYAIEPTPHSFYGTVKISGQDAQIGIVVKAKFGATECGTYTITEAGKYGDDITKDYLGVTCEGLHEGDTITFYLNDVDTGETAEFHSGGGPTELNLAVDIPVGGIVVPVDKLGLLSPWVIGSTLILVAVVWLVIWNRRRGTVTTSSH
ncbi:hypothetical protein ACFLVG_04245 [Chloroflexota bacterium]